MSSELENSGIRVAVDDCSVTERRRWRPPYQTGKTEHVHAKHYKHNEDGRTAPGVCSNGSVPLSHSGNVVTRNGIRTHIKKDQSDNAKRNNDFFSVRCSRGSLSLCSQSGLFALYFSVVMFIETQGQTFLEIPQCSVSSIFSLD